MPSQSPIAITAQDLSKRFNREWIFRKFNYQFQSGNIYAITGPNGSGKSTLLQILCAYLPQTSGSINYETSSKTAIPVEEIYKYVSIATPYMDLIDELTLLEHLKFHFNLKKIRDHLNIDDLLRIMYLDEAKNKYLGNFSSGMRHRVKLALAFYTQADLIFLDEPGTNLDKQAFEWYYQQLLKLPKECIVIIASNNALEYPENAKILSMSDFK